MTVSDPETAAQVRLAELLPEPKKLGIEVGPDGGMLQLNGFDLVVPSGLLSETIVITATELPSQTTEVAEDLERRKLVATATETHEGAR